MPNKCIENGCIKRSTYNLPTEIKAIYCKKHKLPIMIDVISKKCFAEGCVKQPAYNIPTETKALYCNEHKLENMINIRTKKCIADGCKKCPTYNIPNKTKALYCSVHKLENMVDIKNKRCIANCCIKLSSYNLPTETKALYCSEHKLANMIDIKHKRCIFDGCIKQPIYNLPTETKALYCSEHKLVNMIDIKHTKCIFDGCIKRPTYNILNETKAIYCYEHKLENMVDVENKRCISDGCIKRPYYNIPTEINALYCIDHKNSLMINTTNKSCQFAKCKETSIFGIINKRPQYCIKHKQKNMINLVLENKCSVLDCEEEHTQIIDNTKYCNNHIPEDALIKVKRLCKYCDIKEQSDYICNDCKKIQNKKEWAIVRYLRKVIDTKFEYNSSKMLQGCSKKRPDIFFELNKHCVIVEIDENQHNSYEDTCECARINEIVNGIGGRSVIIIRYNPDIIRNIHKILNINQQDKINLLVKTIKKELATEYDKFIVKHIQLYFNDDYEVYQPIKEENITDLVCI